MSRIKVPSKGGSAVLQPSTTVLSSILIPAWENCPYQPRNSFQNFLTCTQDKCSTHVSVSSLQKEQRSSSNIFILLSLALVFK